MSNAPKKNARADIDIEAIVDSTKLMVETIVGMKNALIAEGFAAHNAERIVVATLESNLRSEQ